MVHFPDHAVLNPEAFRRIREMILRRGDRRTYCNRYNDNPHIEVAGFHAYLNPADRHNLRCDLARSDFDELVIQDWQALPIYTHARLQGGRLTFEAGEADALLRYMTLLLAADGSA